MQLVRSATVCPSVGVGTLNDSKAMAALRGRVKIQIDRERAAGSSPNKPTKTSARVDISVILNLHDEARYLLRTLRSLQEAMQYTAQFGPRMELVVVLDNADADTQSALSSVDLTVFDHFQVIEVAHGSLGPSRHAGIDAARGAIIATADGDDLVGFDYFHRMHAALKAGGPKSIICPEFYLGFGTTSYVWRFLPLKTIGAAAMMDNHPFVSRIMLYREAFNELHFADVSYKSGYAYEDWHFNCSAVAQGYDIAIAKDALVFYRERQRSMSRRFRAETPGLIPPSPFFEPARFHKIAWADFNGDLPRSQQPTFSAAAFVDLPGMADLVAAANAIDPAISLGILKDKHGSTNFTQPAGLSRAYFELCGILAGQEFTDILLVPYLTRGGGEKFILSVLSALKAERPDTRCLVLGGQRIAHHHWVDRLPNDSLFVDLHSLGITGLSEADIETITLRIIQHQAGLKRLHLKHCEYVDAFMRNHADRLGDVSTYFYHFCEATDTIHGLRFENGFGFDLITEAGHRFDGIISDHQAVLTDLQVRLGDHVTPKLHALYAACSDERRVFSDLEASNGRLLWASRIDRQKRPELLAEIARGLQTSQPGLVVDVFGNVGGGSEPECLQNLPNLVYHGTFDGLSTLDVGSYDALIYTAAFDGLPNVVLEAMSAGLPVIAPAVGGIGEAVSIETGFLVPDLIDDDALASAYLAALAELYADPLETRRRSDNARRLIESRHSISEHQTRVDQIFTDPVISKDGISPERGIQRANGVRATKPLPAGPILIGGQKLNAANPPN
jgi:glycosyltransferase involved in cell wall biosynthesis